MKKILFSMFVMAGLMLVAAPARAADVDGKWSGSLDTPMGAIQVGFNFKADGATLTGTTTGPDGGEIAIKNGKIDADKISFVISIDFGGMAFDLNYTGVVGKDSLAMTLDFMGMPMAFTVKKAQ
jgi:opacity protein-like surface antigen